MGWQSGAIHHGMTNPAPKSPTPSFRRRPESIPGSDRARARPTDRTQHRMRPTGKRPRPLQAMPLWSVRPLW